MTLQASLAQQAGVTAASAEGGGTPQDWLDPAWNRRVKITSQASAVAVAYPYALVVDCGVHFASVAEFWGNVKADGSDIRVTRADGVTEVARGVRGFDTGNEAGTIYLHHPDISAASDQDLWIYWGNSAASDYADDNALGMQGVWADEDIELHLTLDAEDISGSTAIDQSGNGRDGTINGSPSAVAGQIAGGLAMGSGVYIEVPFFLDPNAGPATIMLLCNPNSVAGTHSIVHQNDGSGIGRATFIGDGNLSCVIGGVTLSGATTITTGVWHQTAARWASGGSGLLTVILDGADDGSDTRDPESATGSHLIGTTKSLTGLFDGLFDDVRFYSRALSTDELATIYNNAASNGAFWSAGAIESLS